MNTLWQDIRYAVRMMGKNLSVTAIVVVVLALGIGANTAIFSVVNAALLRPLPFADPGRIVFLWNKSVEGEPNPLGPGRMLDFRRQVTSFESSAAIAHISYTLTGAGDTD